MKISISPNGQWLTKSGRSACAHANGKYVTAEQAGSLPLIANRTAIGPWEQFDQINLGGGDIAVRAHANGRYVTAEQMGS
jgi:hypothetical protein